MRLGRIVLVLLVAAGAATGAWAQTGGLRVRVIDGSDKTPMPGVVITLSNVNKYVATTNVVSDAQGEALFPVLRAGAGYVIEAFMDGYARQRLPEIRVKLNETTTVPIVMVPTQVERVEVIGEKSVVDLEKTSTSTKYSEEFIQDLPVPGRFYQNVLTLAPGVQDADGDGNPNVYGARERDFKAQVNGVSNQDPLTGGWMSYVNSDSIEEVEVITAGAGGGFSRAQGGFAQIIQKQGSNDFEGVFSMLYRSSKLDGNGATNLPSNRIAPFALYQPAIQVSGPIVKDKLWYRASQEIINQDDPVALSGSVEVVKTRQTNHDYQMTWQVSPRNKLALQFRFDPYTIVNAGVSALSPVSTSRKYKQGAPTYTLSWTAPYSPKLLVESLVSYQNFRLDITPTEFGVPNTCVVGVPLVARSQCFDLQSGEVSGSFPVEWHDNRQRMTFKSDGTFFAGKVWGMNHQLRFGVSAENERYYRELTQRPQANFFVVTPGSRATNPNEEPSLDQIAITTVDIAVPETTFARATGSNYLVYVEDQIKPLNNLSFNLTLQYSHEQVDSNGFEPFDPAADAAKFIELYRQNPDLKDQYEVENFTAYEGLQDFARVVSAYVGFDVSLSGIARESTFWQKTRRPENIHLANGNFEPRFSTSWDPWSDGKTKFTASAGRYYDKVFLAVPLIELEPVGTTITFDARREAGRTDWIVDPITQPINPALNVSVVDRHLRTPFQDEFTLGFERELWAETSIKVTYVRRNFKDQLQDINLNKIPGDYGRCFKMLVPSNLDRPVVESPGTGPVVDDYTGQVYEDTDPGIGDGRLDDCAGSLLGVGADENSQFGRARLVQRPDGIPDLYTQNPAWGDIFLVGNFNTAKYSGLTIQLDRRNYRNWQMDASYTWSRAIGDAEDFQLALGDDRSTTANERGFLSYDQRHVVKVNATTVTPWGFRLGTSVQWQSGLPYSILHRDFAYSTFPPYFYNFGTPDAPVRTTYPTQRRNDQRNRPYWNIDLKATKEMNLPKGMNLQMSAEIFNLLNDDTYIVYNPFFKYGQQINGNNDAYRRFGRRYQLGVRLAF